MCIRKKRPGLGTQLTSLHHRRVLSSSPRLFREGSFKQVEVIMETLRTDQSGLWPVSFCCSQSRLDTLSEPRRICLQILPGSAAANRMSVGGDSLSPLRLFQEPEICSGSATVTLSCCCPPSRWHVFWILPLGLQGRRKFLEAFWETVALGRMQRGNINSTI